MKAMNLLKQLLVIVIFTVPCLCASGSSPVSVKKGLTLEGARKVIAAAEAYAKEHDAPGGAIAVVDDGGNLMALERLDGTFSAGPKISIGKAQTVVLFKKPTKVFEDLINKGRTTMVALEDFTPLQGGIPIVVNGEIIGGIGVSGASSAQQDEEVAIAGAEAAKQFSSDPLTSSHPGVSYFPREEVDDAFAKGAVLFERGGNYAINTSRRDSPGVIELHEKDSDIIYVIKGSATFITGGTVLDGKKVAENEIRGTQLNDGALQTLVAGDVIVVPAGTPHWFKEVHAPFLYYTVKVR
jgi:glc operon protein GlcG